jgi:bilin biosynthesis protein
MSNALNSENQLSQTETDALLQAVSEQLANNTFDTSDRQLLQQMVESMGDTRGMVRFGFAERLGAVGKPAIPFLLDALANHNNPVVRRASAKTLTLIADPVAIPTLVRSFLNDEDTVVRGSAVGALARTGKTSVPALLEILASSEQSESTKGHAAWALSFIGTEAKEYLYEAIDSDSPEVRAAVVGAIAKVAQEKSEDKAYNILINALNDSAENVRCEAAALLGNLTHRSAIPNLTQLLQHQEGETRKAAALALMKIGDRKAIESLQSALNQESEENVQKAIALAIFLLQRKSESEDDDWG